jgi:hypothetical protein
MKSENWVNGLPPLSDGMVKLREIEVLLALLRAGGDGFAGATAART